nr:recombinase family protein [uncultured Acetatifactor sp.]
MNKKYCAYLRKSRADRDAEQNGSGDTLARHRELLGSYAEKHHIQISRFYSEVVSGDTIDGRPVMQKLLADVESGQWDGVLVVEVERLARGNTRDQGIVAETFKYSDTMIITPSKTYDPNNEFDEEYFEFGLFMSRREFKTINRRLQRGRLASVGEGKFVGSTPPYGYRKVKLPHDKGYTLEIIPEQAQVVRQIFQWYVNGEVLPDGSSHRLGTDTIAAKLDALGVKPCSSMAWSKATIRDMLRNETYAGMIVWGKEKEVKTSENGRVVKTRTRSSEYKRVQGLHPAIIDPGMFSSAQECLKNMSKCTSPVSTGLQNPLSGIIYCRQCGSLMTRLAPNTRNKYSTLKCPNRYCRNVSSPIFLVENQLLNFLQEWLDKYDLNRQASPFAPLEEQIAEKEQMLKTLDADLSTYQGQREKAYDLLERGVYTIEVFQQRQKTLQDTISRLEASRDELLADMRNINQIQEEQEAYIPKIRNLLENYRTNTPETNNRILKEVIDRMLYEKTEPNRRGQLNNCNFSLEVYPKLPR